MFLSKWTKLVLLLICFALFTIGCKKQKEITYSCYGNTDADTACYSAILSEVVNKQANLVKVFDIDDKCCIIWVKYIEDGNSEYTASFYDYETGEEVNNIVLDVQTAVSFCKASNNRIACSTSTGYKIFDSLTGNLVKEKEDLIRNMSEDPVVENCSDGFVFLTGSVAYKISPNGKVIGSVHYDLNVPSHECAYFEKNGLEYLITYGDIVYNYYRIDFDTGKVEQLPGIEEYGLSNALIYHGSFVYDTYMGCIYELNMEDFVAVPCSYIQNMLLRPMQMENNTSTDFFFLDANKYVVVYSYPSDLFEIQFVSRDDTLDLTSRERITVKGYHVNEDLGVLWATYLYNTSQNDYFVALETYGMEYRYSNSGEAQSVHMRLIQDFSNGNCPDIFYGNEFDYEYLGRAGMVIDMSEYMGSSSINTSEFLPSVRDLMLNDEHCFQVFSGFNFVGFWGKGSVFDGQPDCAFEQISSPEFSRKLFADYNSWDIAAFLIKNPINKLQTRDFISEEDIALILRYAVENGADPQSNLTADSVEAVARDDHALYLGYNGAPIRFFSEQFALNDDLRFIGYPTIGDCAHSIAPRGLMAISAGTDCPDQCFEFIKYLFSDEVQRRVLAQNNVPVNKRVLDEFIDMMRSPESIDNDPLYEMISKELNIYFFGGQSSDEYYHISDREINNYYQAVNSIDTIEHNDWEIYNIIVEEVTSYYNQGKSIDEIAASLRNRLMLYMQENYF